MSLHHDVRTLFCALFSDLEELYSFSSQYICLRSRNYMYFREQVGCSMQIFNRTLWLESHLAGAGTETEGWAQRDGQRETGKEGRAQRDGQRGTGTERRAKRDGHRDGQRGTGTERRAKRDGHRETGKEGRAQRDWQRGTDTEGRAQRDRHRGTGGAGAQHVPPESDLHVTVYCV